MIKREYYYRYNDKIVIGINGQPERSGGRLIGKRKKSNDDDDNQQQQQQQQQQQPQLTTSHGFTSSGNTVNGSRPRMRAKWPKTGGRSTELETMRRQQQDPIKQNVINDIGQHCKALRDDSASLVDCSER